MLGTDPETKVRQVPIPHCVLYFEQGEAIRVEANNMEGVSLVMLERAGMMLTREVQKQRQQLARTRPETHESGWNQPEKVNVA